MGLDRLVGWKGQGAGRVNNLEFLPDEIRYASSCRKFHWLKMVNFE